MSHKLLPITTDLMLRNIIGRLDGTDRYYRALRITPVEGDIVNVPYLPPGLPPGSPEAFRTLLAYALVLGTDGNPVVRVHFSNLNSVRAYDAERGAMRMPEYINELFVVVKRADDSEVVCVNLKAMGLLADCPTIEELLVSYVGEDIVIRVVNGTEEVPSVSIEDDGESYELTEGVHFTYDGTDITILDTTLSGYLSGEGTSIVIIIQFGDCEPIEVQADYGIEPGDV